MIYLSENESLKNFRYTDFPFYNRLQLAGYCKTFQEHQKT